MKTRLNIMLPAMLLAAFCCFKANAQGYAGEVAIDSQTGSTIVFSTTIAAEKAGKDAEAYAAMATLYTVLADGVDGLKGTQPMVSELRNDYLYRMETTRRWAMMLDGKPVKVRELKLPGVKKLVYTVPVNVSALQKDVEKNQLALNHAWADKGKENVAASTLNPVICVIPEVEGGGASFETMRDAVENDDAMKAAVNGLLQQFSAHGYKTRDFRTALENSKTDDLLRSGTQSDVRTMIVQSLPGDIVVKTEVDLKQANGSYGVNVSVRAVEKQTEGVLAAETFSSGMSRINDPGRLVAYALEKTGDAFFTKLADAFAEMAKKGRAMQIDFALSQNVSDWDFDSESPADGSEFRDELEEWLRSQAFQGVYDMSASTDKYIKATLNLPLWDYDKNRTYRITNFTSALKKFLRSKLGDEYKPTVTALGQKLSIIIE